MDEKITFYTTHCPKCTVLEMKLKQKNISYDECSDVTEMFEQGIKSAPVLKIETKDSVSNTVNVEILDFNKAISWINSKGN